MTGLTRQEIARAIEAGEISFSRTDDPFSLSLEGHTCHIYQPADFWEMVDTEIEVLGITRNAYINNLIRTWYKANRIGPTQDKP